VMRFRRFAECQVDVVYDAQVVTGSKPLPRCGVRGSGAAV
jgi:hypothetical protein